MKEKLGEGLIKMLEGLIKMECPILFLNPHFGFAPPPLNKMKKPKVITVISLVFFYFASSYYVARV